MPYGDPAKDTVVELRAEPEEIFMTKPGETAPLKVVARYQDDQTARCDARNHVESNVPDVASVDRRLTSVIRGERVGEATLLVRYQGKFGAIPVTVLNPKPGFVWKPLPQHNYIDRLIDAKLERLKIQPSAATDDATFLRRVSLDLTGRLPSPESVRAFLGDPGPSRVKRAKTIDKLIASPEYVDHWTVKWGDLLQSSRKFLGEKGAYEFQQWIRDAIASNRPYDKLVRELLTARGSSYDNPAANLLPRHARGQAGDGEDHAGVPGRPHGVRAVPRSSVRALDAESVLPDGGVLLGGGHPRRIRSGRGDRVRSARRLRDEASEGRARHEAEVHARVGRRSLFPTARERREALADWLTSKDNPFFAKAIVNRMWSYFVGKGIIDPVDDIRASNPPSNPALLDALTKDFVAHDFDLRHLMRTIVNSRTYQASIVTNEWNASDRDNFSHAIPRRLSAEQLMDAVASAAGVRPRFPEVPEDTAASQLVDPHIGKEGFLDVFGRPARESSCECERRADFSLPQALNLVNGRTISDAVADPKGRVAKLVLSGKSDGDHRRRAVSCGAEPPPDHGGTPARIEVSVDRQPKASRAQDLLWALLNSKGFLYILLKGQTDHAESSRTPRLQLRRTHPPRTAAHRLASA